MAVLLSVLALLEVGDGNDILRNCDI